MFSIGFTDGPLEYPYDDTGVPAAPGRLVLEKSTEEFLANLHLWAKSDYESHWTRELKTLLDGNTKAALVVSYNESTPGFKHGDLARVPRRRASPFPESNSLVQHSPTTVRGFEIEPIYSRPNSSNSGGQPDLRMGRSHPRH